MTQITQITEITQICDLGVTNRDRIQARHPSYVYQAFVGDLTRGDVGRLPDEHVVSVFPMQG